MDALIFAQQFPFSDAARNYLKQMDIPLDKVPDSAIRRAALMISRANVRETYLFESANPSKELYEHEIIAFPVAKMLVSLLSAPNLREKFAGMIAKSTFTYLTKVGSRRDECITLADDLKIKYVLSEKDFFVHIPVLEYCDMYFTDEESKLVNKVVANGNVFLTLNDFARFLSEKAYQKVFDSLPIDKKQIPVPFQVLARSLDSQLITLETKRFDEKIVGKMDPTLFPPCMAKLYADQLAGKKLPYSGRLALASFLYQLGMSKTELIALNAKSPDYKKEVTEYHVNRIFEKGLSAPSCKKIAEMGLRVSACDKECTVAHPQQYYLQKLRVKNRMKNRKNADGSM